MVLIFRANISSIYGIILNTFRDMVIRKPHKGLKISNYKESTQREEFQKENFV